MESLEKENCLLFYCYIFTPKEATFATIEVFSETVLVTVFQSAAAGKRTRAKRLLLADQAPPRSCRKDLKTCGLLFTPGSEEQNSSSLSAR